MFLFQKLKIESFPLLSFLYILKHQKFISFSCVNFCLAEIIFVFIVLYYRADQIIEVNRVMKNVFRCIKWTNITDNSYHYYVLNGNTKLIKLLKLVCI